MANRIPLVLVGGELKQLPSTDQLTDGASVAIPNSLLPLAIKTNIDYTFALGDDIVMVMMNSGSAHNLTVPANATVAFPVGTFLTFFQWGTGAVTLVPDTGVSIETASDSLTFTSRWNLCFLYQRSANVWNFFKSPPSSSSITLFTANGTWTKPLGCTKIEVFLIGGGGGGGSGRRGLAATARFGGGGGGGAAWVHFTIPASLLTATVAVVVGQGGAGGAAIGVNNTDGNTGTSGTASTFDIFRADFGAGGGGGTAIGGNGGAPGGGEIDGGSGGTSFTNGTAQAGLDTTEWGAAGGGGGGGIDASDVARAGGAGGRPGADSLLSRPAAGTAGAVATTGGAGGAQSRPTMAMGGAGGGGGGARIAAGGAAGSGGAGGNYGAGGGGGGAALNTSASGAGGAGTDGIVVVIEHF